MIPGLSIPYETALDYPRFFLIKNAGITGAADYSELMRLVFQPTPRHNQ